MSQSKGAFKRRIYSLVETVAYEDIQQKHLDFFDIFIMALISLNVVAVILESFEPIRLRYHSEFSIFEIFSVIVFTVEYLLRLWSCTINPTYAKPFWGRVRFSVSPLAIIDLMAILPFYLPILLPIDLRFLRAVRLLRLLRVLKFGRYSDSMKLFGQVLKNKKSELTSALIILLILLIISSSLLYSVEKEAQPDKFPNILASMWWGVATLTTVGYGDVYPITWPGKLFGAIISLLGIGLFALPTGILSAGFIEAIKEKNCSEKKCPHCGGALS
jgi:voltage-gated potassium channel